MTERSDPQGVRRQAGLAYLLIIVFSMAGYVTLSWLLGGEPELALARLVENQTSFILAFAASGVGFAAWVVLAILLYRLMNSAGRIAALLMLTFAVAGTAMNLVALAQLFPLVRSASAVGPALASMVRDYNHWLLLAQVFSGLWLFPFGWLVWHSRIAPRLLGLCLAAGGVFYLLVFATAFEPALDQSLVYRIVSVPTGILGFAGELGMCLWLLFKGARAPGLAPAA